MGPRVASRRVVGTGDTEVDLGVAIVVPGPADPGDLGHQVTVVGPRDQVCRITVVDLGAPVMGLECPSAGATAVLI